MVLSYVAATAQYTYDVTYHEDAGNPGGVNTASDFSTTGYTQLSNGGESANFWSDVYALPFAFDFYGQPVTHFKVSANGVITFDTLATAIPVDANTNLPTVAASNIPNNSILAFWDAFSGSPPIGSTDRIWVGVNGTAPNRQVQIDYYSYEYGSTGSAVVASYVYFGLILEETTGNIYIMDKNYGLGHTNLTTTIGVQKDAATAVQWGDSTMAMKTGGSSNADNDYYQFSPRLLVADNAAVTSIDNPALPTCALANQDVKATIYNDGTNTINSVTVNWSINGVAQTPLAYATPLAVGASAQVTLGNYSFNSFDNLEVWTSMPNGNADGNTANDSMSVILATGLVGTFTIDSLLPASGTNFQSFSDAVAAMTTAGFCGPVTFNVAAGTWDESISLPDMGNDMTQPVTFNGAGQGVTKLTYDGSATQNATVNFAGADWVTFKNMTIENTKTGTNAWVVHFTNASDHNTIDSCHILGDKTATTSSNLCILGSASATSATSGGDNNSYTVISNSTIEGGYYGIRFYGTSSSDNVYNQIINTHIKEQYYYGVYGAYQDSLTVTSSVIESGRNTFCSGIYSFSSHNANIQSNWVKPQKTYGIYMSSVTGTNGGRSQIINNMTTVDNVSAEALYVTSPTDMDIFHNSCKSTAEQAFYMSGSGAGVDIRNNIFVSESNSTVDMITTFAGTAFANNVIYRIDGTGNLLENGTANFIDITSINGQGGVFANNVGSDPNFVDASTGDLHVTVGSGLIAGDNTVGVLVDIDGDARPFAPTTIVDIGADEIFVQNLDAGVTSFDSPLAPVSTGMQDIKVSIKNNGATPLTAATINWAVDGVVQTPFSWTNAGLTIGNEDSDITIGQYNITAGFTQFEIWTSAPNAGVDGDPSNDTLVYDLCTALTGTYTVGSAPTDDFNSIAAAADAVSGCGVSGPVTINISAGTYVDPVYLGVIAGASATNKITFDGIDKDSVLLTHIAGAAGQNATILFDGADHVTIKNMTIENMGTTYMWGVRLQNGSDFNTISDNRIVVDPSATTSLSSCILASGLATSTSGQGNNANDLTIINNELLGSYYSIRLNGLYNSSTPIEAELNINNKIQGNIIDSSYVYPIYAAQQANLTIDGNTIMNQTGTGSTYGIYMFDIQNPSINDNFIKDVRSFGYGIYLNDGNTNWVSNKRGKITNNMVSVTGTAAEALYFFDVDDMDIYHNTLSADGEQAFYLDDYTRLDIRNNIFSTNGAEVVHFVDAIGASDVVDYNIYYNSNGGTIVREVNDVYSDILSWQTGNGGTQDLNSDMGDPVYADLANGDLHLIGGIANDVGDNSVPVARDIDGEVRPQAPSTVRDIGADEYTPLNDDARAIDVYFAQGGCPTATDTVWAVVQNLGLNTINTLPINVDITGDANASISTTASVNLPFLAEDTIMVGTFNSTAGGDYEFTAYTNLAGDQRATNDTTSGSGGRFYLEGTITDVGCLGDSTGAIAQLLLNAQGLDGSLTTNLTSNNGCSANYFDVNVLKVAGLVVTGFEVNVSAAVGTPVSVEFHYKTGTWVGFDGTPTAWTNGGIATGVAAGINQPTVVTLPAPIVLPTGTNGIYIGTTSGWRYINGTASGNLWASNNDLEIFEGAGDCTLQVGGGGFLNIPRNFSGSILYQGQEPVVTWSTADTTVNIDGLVGGTYTVTVTDGIGCVNTASYTVAQPTVAPPAVTLDASTDVTCYGAADGTISTTVTGGTGILNYAWSNGDATASIMNLDTGSYSLVVSDANGCTDSTGAMNIIISQPDTLIAMLDTVMAIGCDTYEIFGTVTGGNGGYTYSWTGGTTNPTLIVTATGNYMATVKDSKGCSDDFSASVTLPNALAATATVTAADTAGAGVGAATVTATGGTMPYNFLWSDGQTTPDATGLAAGNYDVTVTDVNGCVVTTATVTIGFPTGITGIEAFNSLEMFPNPTTGMVTFNVSLKSSSDLTITIYDVAGREITNFTSNNTMMITETFDASTLAEGVYLVRFIAGEDGVVTKRLVVGAK